MKNNYQVNQDFAEMRLDRWFKKCIHDVPQSFIEKNIRKGKIKVNNKKVKSSYKLKFNDNVTIYDLNFTKKLDKKISAFNVGINIGKDAGQLIMHCHIHLIPRRKGDVEDPRGGVRGVIPEKQKYKRK